jgi:hypothetical protein
VDVDLGITILQQSTDQIILPHKEAAAAYSQTPHRLRGGDELAARAKPCSSGSRAKQRTEK